MLIDNEFALNVCPFRTTFKVVLDLETIISSPLTVKAYDNTSRKVMGTLKAPCKIGPLETIVEFHVVDITPNLQSSLRKGKASSHWSYSFYFALKDEDPMERRDCCSTWRW